MTSAPINLQRDWKFKQICPSSNGRKAPKYDKFVPSSNGRAPKYDKLAAVFNQTLNSPASRLRGLHNNPRIGSLLTPFLIQETLYSPRVIISWGCGSVIRDCIKPQQSQ